MQKDERRPKGQVMKPGFTSQLYKELALAESAPVISQAIQKLDEYRITTNCGLEDEEFLLTVKGKPCFPRRDLTTITGQAKSGKTMLISMLMVCCTQEDNQGILGIKRVRQERMKVMWVDTEQSPQSTLRILKERIQKIVTGDTEGVEFPEELFYVFNIRGVIVDERYDLLAEGVALYQPDIVIIDNIRDLIHDINDGPKAQELIEKLMHLATENSCNVVTVLHQNRSADNRGLRGWLGTELMNKVFEVFSCQKLKQKEGTKPLFCVEQTMTRKFDIDSPLYYQVDSQGLPVAADMKEVQKRNAQGQFASKDTALEQLNRDYIIESPEQSDQPWTWNLEKLFTDAMGGWQIRSAEDMENRVKELSHIKQKQYYYRLLEEAIEKHVVRRELDRCGRVAIMLAPK